MKCSAIKPITSNASIPASPPDGGIFRAKPFGRRTRFQAASRSSLGGFRSEVAIERFARYNGFVWNRPLRHAGVIMHSARRHLRPFWVALLAIVGMLSVADVALACTTKPASAPRACCAERPPSECGCCTSGETLPSSGVASHVDAVVSSPARVLYQAPSPSCECRASEPAAPSERPAQRMSTERSEVKGFETFATLAPAHRRTPSLSRLRLPNESPPRSPLYLRNSRLLI